MTNKPAKSLPVSDDLAHFTLTQLLDLRSLFSKMQKEVNSIIVSFEDGETGKTVELASVSDAGIARLNSLLSGDLGKVCNALSLLSKEWESEHTFDYLEVLEQEGNDSQKLVDICVLCDAIIVKTPYLKKTYAYGKRAQMPFAQQVFSALQGMDKNIFSSDKYNNAHSLCISDGHPTRKYFGRRQYGHKNRGRLPCAAFRI